MNCLSNCLRDLFVLQDCGRYCPAAVRRFYTVGLVQSPDPHLHFSFTENLKLQFATIISLLLRCQAPQSSATPYRTTAVFPRRSCWLRQVIDRCKMPIRS